VCASKASPFALLLKLDFVVIFSKNSSQLPPNEFTLFDLACVICLLCCSVFLHSFEAGFGEDTPPPSSDDDVVATGMVRGGLAFGLDHSDNDDDDDDDDSDRDDSDRQVMPQTHRGFPGSSMSSKSSSGNTGGFLFPNHCVGGEGTLSTAVPGASSGMATDVDMARPITFDEAFPTGIYPVDSPLPAGFTSVSAPAPHPTATLSGFSSFTTTRPALNTEVVELNESDSD